MKTKSFEGMACSIAAALEQAGDKWSMLILRDLRLGLSRFDQLEQSLGISTNTLTSRLKSLEQNGMVERFPYQDRPLRHAYRLTRKGDEFTLVLAALLQWGDRWRAKDLGGSPMRLVDGEGGPVRVAMISENTGAEAARVRPVPGPAADDRVYWRLDQARATAGGSEST